VKKLLVVSALLIVIISGCSIYQTIMNLSRLKFKLEGVDNFRVADIKVADKQSAKDFNSMDMLKLSSNVIGGKLPVTFMVNVEAKNPNDGSGGYPSTGISIKSFPWRLYLDDRETVSGNISEPIYVPGKGEATKIPIRIELDLIQFFKDRNIGQIVDLVLNLGGAGKNPSKVKLIVDPVLDTPIGDLKYPNSITIVDTEYH